MEQLKEMATRGMEKAAQMMQRTEGITNNTLTKESGCPVGHAKNSLTAGPHGPVVVSDHHLLEKILHFNREKTPPRNVHALGMGCYGTFTVTNDITKWTRAKLFSQVGKKTEIAVRMSGIFTEVGDPDTTRDPRGFAIKFYTEEGNWDLLGINTPVFNVRDAKLGPDAVHACKRDPRTGMWNPTQTWDFAVNHPESLHQFMMMYTDRMGTPASYRYMHAYGCHTFSFINANNERFWCKFHLLSQQGAMGLTKDQAKMIGGEDPNFLSRDLWQAIEMGNYPKWKLCCQIMPEEEGYRRPFTFDATKVWKHSEYPLIEIGIVELNRNVVDYFAEVEQIAFSPANLVPGIGLSPDKLLQGRLLIYDDSQMHRIGPNFKQLYVNCPHATVANTMDVGGNMHIEVRNKFPHYLHSSQGGYRPDPQFIEPPLKCDGNAAFYDWELEGTDADYYAQPRDLWKLLSDKDKNNLCENIAASIEKVTVDEVVTKLLEHLSRIDADFSRKVSTKLTDRKTGVAKKTEQEMITQTMAKTLLKSEYMKNV